MTSPTEPPAYGEAIRLYERLVAALTRHQRPEHTIPRRLPDARYDLTKVHATVFGYPDAVRHGHPCIDEYQQ